MRTVVHLSPHPDDELIGAPATLMALRDAGWRIVNVACGLGRPAQSEQRRAELEEASRQAGFVAVIPEDPPIVSSREDDVETVSFEVRGLVSQTIRDMNPEIVVSPSPHDRHPSHELVGRAVRDILVNLGGSLPSWWMWGLWGPLPVPTLGTVFVEARLEEIESALAAHAGEIARNDYRRFVRARAQMNATLAPELLFGFGCAAMADTCYVELLTEAQFKNDRWLLGQARWFDPTEPLKAPSEIDIGDWLYTKSLTDLVGAPSRKPNAKKSR